MHSSSPIPALLHSSLFSFPIRHSLFVLSMEDRGDAVPGVNNLANSSSSDVDNGYSPPVVKGKRTKRRRLRQFLLPAATPSTSSSSSGFSDGVDDEDMANCLILLARGQALEAEQKTYTPVPLGGDGDGARCSRGDRDQVGSSRGERYTSRRLAEAPTMTDGKVSFYVYECKTCNKCFPTFQALGGHRSSHKKLKIAAAAAASKQKNNTSMEELTLQIGIGCSYSKPTVPPSSNNNNGFRSPALHNSKNTAVPNNNHCSSSNSNINVHANNITKPKVHECSICGAEFSSGQALGGHMRRHRADVTTTTSALQETKDQKSALALDLNLPAPTDDDHGDPCSKRPPIIFSPSPLVGCHY